MKRITVIGSTGSIGTQTLDVALSRGFKVEALAANKNHTLVEKQARMFRPCIAAMFDEQAAKTLKLALSDTDTKVLAGEAGIEEAASMKVDTVVNGAVGIAGLRPTLAALSAGNVLALANKESLVCAGETVMKLAREKNLMILPVDSEHSAVFQAMGRHKIDEVEKIILTASGGPFYFFTEDQLKTVTPEQALKHPSWNMGQKITIDCATMMNKGFELMEARFLFDAPVSKLSYIIHRESLVHSMVQFIDGSLIAQISPPDMRLPIVYALDYPIRHKTDLKRFDFLSSKISFLPPREDVFTAPLLCLKALSLGGNAGAVLNGANEQAVMLFLNKKIGFNDITSLTAEALESVPHINDPSVSEIFDSDKEARRFITDKVKS